MEIKKIDRKRIQEEKEEKVRIARAKARIARQMKAAQKLKGEKIPKKRLVLYASVAAVLIITSLAYNFLTFSQAKRPIQTGTDRGVDTLTMAFYDLCNDIEDIKLEQGAYPESIKELGFSDSLTYVLLSDGSFLLAYDDGQTSLSYDSSKDHEEIE
jgi:hypothetical protein